MARASRGGEGGELHSVRGEPGRPVPFHHSSGRAAPKGRPWVRQIFREGPAGSLPCTRGSDPAGPSPFPGHTGKLLFAAAPRVEWHLADYPDDDSEQLAAND